MRNLRTGWIGLVLLGILVGCGGSGGDGDGSSGGTTGFTAAKLQDAGEAGTDVLSSSYSLTSFSGMVMGSWAEGTAAKTADRAAELPVLGLCTSGTLDAEYDDVDADETFSSGDTVTFTFADCELTLEDEPLRFNGTLQVTVVTVDSWPEPPYSLELQLAFTPGFTVDSEDGTSQISGGFTYSESSEDGTAYQLGLDGSSLSFVETDDTGTYTTTLTDFTNAFTIDEGTGAFTADADGVLYDSGLGMTVTYETTTPFAGTGDENPSSGVMVLTDSGGSRVTLTALDSTWVELTLDEDGDGTPEETLQVRWDDL